jgi:fatty acid desaturase
VIATDIVLGALVGAPCWLLGWREYLLVQMPSALLAGSAGVWLFYVQHQFEDPGRGARRARARRSAPAGERRGDRRQLGALPR